jgi:hypothetical protein
VIRFLTIAAILVTSQIASADQYVRGYERSNGTYVEPYHRTSPNNTIRDNYSTRPNVNPYTGHVGTVNPNPNQFGNQNMLNELGE